MFASGWGCGGFQCTASECLSLSPVIARFIQRVGIPLGHCLQECQSMLALLDFVTQYNILGCGKCREWNAPILFRRD